MRARTPVATALHIARVSTPELTNTATAVTSLVAVPLLEVLLIVAVAASLGSENLVVTAYAAILLAYGLSIIAGAVGQVTRDRQIGVLQEALTYRFFYVPYWVSKVALPALLGVMVAIASSVGVFVVDPEHSTRALISAVALLPPVAVGASLAAVGIATLSVGFKDPYFISNFAQGALPLTAGVVIPLSSYPVLLAGVAKALPFTAAVEALRAMLLDQNTTTVMLLIGREFVVCMGWLTLGVLLSKYVMATLRSGRRREEIW